MKTLAQTREDAIADPTVKKIVATVGNKMTSPADLTIFLVLAYQSGNIAGYGDALAEARSMVGGDVKAAQ